MIKVNREDQILCTNSSGQLSMLGHRESHCILLCLCQPDLLGNPARNLCSPQPAKGFWLLF